MLIVIASDPRETHRPAEAIRVAAGLAALGSVDIEVCFCQAAALVLGPKTDDLVDAHIIRDHLPLLAQHAKRICAESGDPFLSEPKRIDYQRIGLTELAQWAARQRHVIRF